MENNKITENEIRPDHLMAKHNELLLEDVNFMLSMKSEFVEVSCPACGNDSKSKMFEKYNIAFDKCDVCETVYANPRPTAKQLELYYKQSKHYDYWNSNIFPASEGIRRERIFIPRVDKIIEVSKKYLNNPKTLIEVGAGFGIFCEELNKTKFFNRVIAVEPTPSLAQTCRSKNIEVLECPVEKVKTAEVSADIVASFEVIEHLFDPYSFLISCHKLLAKNGLIFITCPNANGFDVKALETLSPAVDNEHLNLFNPISIRTMFHRAGFRILETSTPGKLDADIVRKALEKDPDCLKDNFIKKLLLSDWNKYGNDFQTFLSTYGLSSSLSILAQKI